MTEIDRRIIVEALQSPWQEYAYWWSQIALLFVAAATACVTLFQLAHIKKSARATFLLELDSRWESRAMAEARRLMTAKIEEAKKKAKEDNIDAGVAFAALLQELRDAADIRPYQKIMSICGFFETAGVMVKNGYVPADDFIKLFGGPIALVGLYYRQHIADRENEAGVLKGLFEHALQLADRVK